MIYVVHIKKYDLVIQISIARSLLARNENYKLLYYRKRRECHRVGVASGKKFKDIAGTNDSNTKAEKFSFSFLGTSANPVSRQQ